MFSLLDYYTASPYLILCGQPRSGRNTFLKQIKLKNKAEIAPPSQPEQQDSASKLTSEQHWTPINYNNQYTFNVRREDNLDALIAQQNQPKQSHNNPTVYLVFIDASSIATSPAVALKLKNWFNDLKRDATQEGKRKKVFIAVSHLDRDDAISIDEIDDTLASNQYKKLLCNCNFPNYDKQVDAIMETVGEASGAKNSLLKDAFQSTSEFRGKLSDRAHVTSQWLTKQSTELADTVSQILSNDDSRLARIVLMGQHGRETRHVFRVFTNPESGADPTQDVLEEASMDIVRDFAGFSFKFYHLLPENHLTETSIDYLATGNAFVFVVSAQEPLDEQRKYFQECWAQVDQSKTPSMVVVHDVQEGEAEKIKKRIEEEWNIATIENSITNGDISSGRFVCTADRLQLERGIAQLCAIVTERQHIKTRESNILAHLFESLPELDLEEGLHSSIQWTRQQQEAIAMQLEGVLSSVTGSVQEYTPQIQETIGKATESVTESAKMVSSAVSSYWNSWWGASDAPEGETNNSNS